MIYKNLTISGRKYPTSQIIYDDNFEIIKKWDGLVNLFVMRISLHGAMWSKYIASFAMFFFTDLGRDSFALPFPMWWAYPLCTFFFALERESHFFLLNILFSLRRLPFDTQNPIGYTIGFFIQYIIFIYICLFNACIVSLSIGSYLSMAALTKDVKGELSWINERVHFKANRRFVWKELFEFIEFHSKAKMLSKWFFHRIKHQL